MKNAITTYEASKRYKLSKGYLRRLVARKILKGRQAGINDNTSIWLIEESSLKAYLKTNRKRGPKPRKR